MKKLKLHTPDITDNNIEKLAALFPRCVTETKDETTGKLKWAIDFDQLRQDLSDHIVDGPRERYHLDWPGKRAALLAANARITETLRPNRAASADFDTTRNLFIEGDNLDALKLLQETYLGKVKLIYIDPPYNTGKDFIYSDNFSEDKQAYLRRTSQKDASGARMVPNTERNGRFHSDWATMLAPRLKLAHELLKEDGVIFISIDDHEVVNLRKMMDETFGEHNFVAQIIWQKLVSARYGTDILINDSQVEEAMDRLKKGADKPQFLLSEIFVAVDRPEDEMLVKASAEQITQQIRQGAPFTAVASQFSQTPSAAEGGDIGWVVQGQLGDELDHAISELRPGQIAGPIRAEGGFYVVQLRDRREPFGTMIEETKPVAADPMAALPLDRLLIPLPPNPDAMLKQRAMLLATNVKSQVRACTDLPNVASQLQGTIYTMLGEVMPKDLNPDLRDALAKTGPGEVVEPFFSVAGLEIIMRCDPAPAKLVAFELPTHDQLQQQLFVQQMTIFAKSYLRDLRRDAVVETR